jgi:aromatic-L-amino-acid decarboxylase
VPLNVVPASHIAFSLAFNFNTHKSMFVTFDCSLLFVKQKKHLIQALSILPPYLRNKATESGQVIDYR